MVDRGHLGLLRSLNAAEVTVDSPDSGHLEPVVDAERARTDRRDRAP
jgi:hypothetical protein